METGTSNNLREDNPNFLKNEQKSSTKDPKILKKKSKDKTGRSWRFFNKVLTAENLNSASEFTNVSNSIELQTGVDLIKELGKSSNADQLVLDEVMRGRLEQSKALKRKALILKSQMIDEEERQRRRKAKQKEKKKLQKNKKKKNISQEKVELGQIITEEENGKVVNLQEKGELDKSNTSTEKRKIDTLQVHQSYIQDKKRLRFERLKLKEKVMSNQEVNETLACQTGISKKEGENFSNKDDPFGQKMAEFYKSLSQDIDVNDKGACECNTLSSSKDEVTELNTLSSAKDETEFSLQPSSFEESQEKLYNENENLAKYALAPLAFSLTETGSLIVALLPNTKIYISGNYYLKLIFGSISVWGYKFKEMEEHAIFSSSLHNLLAINALDGVSLESLDMEILKQYNVPDDWTHKFERMIPVSRENNNYYFIKYS